MRKTPLAGLIQAMFMWPTVALAQTAPAPATPASAPKADLETVVVTGIRASVRQALDAKEASNSMVEVIASEDIGKLPDTTIAETLARLPGLSSGLDRGNASQVIARGLGPRFIGATLNGRELAAVQGGADEAGPKAARDHLAGVAAVEAGREAGQAGQRFGDGGVGQLADVFRGDHLDHAVGRFLGVQCLAHRGANAGHDHGLEVGLGRGGRRGRRGCRLGEGHGGPHEHRLDQASERGLAHLLVSVLSCWFWRR